MIEKTYKMKVDGKQCLRLEPVEGKIRVEMDEYGYGTWRYAVSLDREHVLELRDCLDEILAGWFCPPDPIRLNPAQVAHLDATNICAYPCCDSVASADSRYCHTHYLATKIVPSGEFAKVDPIKLDMGEPVGVVSQYEDDIEEARRGT